MMRTSDPSGKTTRLGWFCKRAESLLISGITLIPFSVGITVFRLWIYIMLHSPLMVLFRPATAMIISVRLTKRGERKKKKKRERLKNFVRTFPVFAAKKRTCFCVRFRRRKKKLRTLLRTRRDNVFFSKIKIFFRKAAFDIPRKA